MTTKRNPKVEQYRNLEKLFMKLNGRSNQSQPIIKGKKCLNQQKQLGFLMSESGLHGDKNNSKKKTDEKNFNLI